MNIHDFVFGFSVAWNVVFIVYAVFLYLDTRIIG